MFSFVCIRGCPPHLSVFTASLDTTLFWPSVGIGFRHWLFRAVRVLVARARHRFLWPGRQCGDNAECGFALILVFCTGCFKQCFSGLSMALGCLWPGKQRGDNALVLVFASVTPSIVLAAQAWFWALRPGRRSGGNAKCSFALREFCIGDSKQCEMVALIAGNAVWGIRDSDWFEVGPFCVSPFCHRSVTQSNVGIALGKLSITWQMGTTDCKVRKRKKKKA